jgi:hypothetical protein
MEPTSLPPVCLDSLRNSCRVERQIEKKEQQLRKIAHEMAQKDDLKTVALGTSKINYMDPRISVAWCKKHDVPIEKVSNSMAQQFTSRKR